MASYTFEYPDDVSYVQALQFELMKQASFNNFDGEAVVAGLLKCRADWHGCLFGCSRYPTLPPKLYALRDMVDYPDWYHGDCVAILCPTEKAQAILSRAERKWHADEADILPPRRAALYLGSPPKPDTALLRIWWD